ncbi:MAG: hypothetical protein CM15mP49_05490 [Actinomycetota bacterium]|nr:MAG: hypothetical protein CM15mP49_05490 [Actinomycetota bacterium]
MAWSTIFILGIQPLYNGGVYPHLEAFVQYGAGNPLLSCGYRYQSINLHQRTFLEANFQVVVAILAPLLFLPMVAPRYVLPALPLFALYLTADVPTNELTEAGQRVPVIVCMFIALIFALRKPGE